MSMASFVQIIVFIHATKYHTFHNRRAFPDPTHRNAYSGFDNNAGEQLEKYLFNVDGPQRPPAHWPCNRMYDIKYVNGGRFSHDGRSMARRIMLLIACIWLIIFLYLHLSLSSKCHNVLFADCRWLADEGNYRPQVYLVRGD